MHRVRECLEQGRGERALQGAIGNPRAQGHLKTADEVLENARALACGRNRSCEFDFISAIE
jgi:hypothetical protein